MLTTNNRVGPFIGDRQSFCWHFF